MTPAPETTWVRRWRTAGDGCDHVVASPPSPRECRLDAVAIERWGLILALAAYALVQVNAVLHRGYVGQDFFAQHVPLIQQAMRDPWGFTTVLTGRRTNPPLYYLLAAGVSVWCGRTRAFEVIAFLNIVINLIGLVLFSRILRRLIGDPVLRLACMVLVLFLPFALIHAVVIACDAPAAAIFFLIAYLCVLLAEAAGRVGSSRWHSPSGWRSWWALESSSLSCRQPPP